MILSCGPNVYQQVQAEQIGLLLAHRSGETERALIARMMAHHELVRRQISARLDPVQTEFEL